MKMLQITAGPFGFTAVMEEEKAPRTCSAFLKMLPLRNKILQVKWCGESAWIPLDDIKLDVGYENHTSHPSPGDILLYPGGIIEPEILFPYGSTCIRSKVGQLAMNHFLTIVDGREHLAELGRLVLWEGAQDIVIELI